MPMSAEELRQRRLIALGQQQVPGGGGGGGGGVEDEFDELLESAISASLQPPTQPPQHNPSLTPMSAATFTPADLEAMSRVVYSPGRLPSVPSDPDPIYAQIMAAGTPPTAGVPSGTLVGGGGGGPLDSTTALAVGVTVDVSSGTHNGQTGEVIHLTAKMCKLRLADGSETVNIPRSSCATRSTMSGGQEASSSGGAESGLAYGVRRLQQKIKHTQETLTLLRQWGEPTGATEADLVSRSG